MLSRAEVARLLDPDSLLDALAAAFEEVSAGRASVPPRVAAVTRHGWLGAMPGYVPGAGLGAKLVSAFPANHELGLPSHMALIALFDEEIGAPLAVMDGTHITTARTAAASALSARVLARPGARVLAVLGSGVQARAHMEAVGRVCPIEEILVASRTPDHAQALAAGDPRARATSFEEAVRAADVVCCCTHADRPVLAFEWLRTGAHVTSVGFNARGPELDRETIVHGRLFVESLDAFEAPPAGAFELQDVDPGAATDLGAVLAGRAPGRRSPEEITVYKSVGHAAEDTTAAWLVYRRALSEGAGVRAAL